MRTLYGLLDALPDDDAESLRAAFRKAAKANHPDNNPGDPDAPLRFRRIVRANAILSDERQRATYDRLLAVARREQRLKFAVAGTVFSVVLIGGYLLFGYVSKASLIIPAQVVEVSAREPASVAAAISPQPSGTIGLGRPRNELDDIGAANKPENPEAVKEAAAPSAAAPAENIDSAPAIANVPAERDVGVKDARYYRERGISNYRSGDIYVALVDFDMAIDLNPNFADAYIDRGVIFYRMGDFKRAFADIAQAKRIDDLNRSQTPLAESQQISSSGKN
ncbi:DnaJ domain-containing protein [Bradyrhizobium canariense]|uniref:DnaJ domain-containing protein n=1 Tax=Bradyrhizobium canariense TaxID=255045 RepID=A0A1H1ZRA6_9BRAD|nr:DnaJ domain-containing protein [Bradyrhizobium canariense]SDT35932.1 DnaJ domain-containing protein [Bradyrhizobium canariense]